MTNLILQGKVIKGEAVGRTIGFPTANLKPAKPPKVKRGVYAALITLKKVNYLGLAYYGKRYIFGEKRDSFEVYIFNFNREIYGKILKVKLLKFLRKPKPVKTLEKLKIILQQDMTSLDQEVILVNRQDKILGIENKAMVHRGRAKLHRAVSVQLFNQKKALLVQRRSESKRLFPLVWANTVCTDVRPYETYARAAERRLKEEFGLTAGLRPAFKFYYSAKWGRESERELDQVFFGLSAGRPRPDRQEISAWQFVSLGRAQNLQPLAPWFKIILKKISLSDIVVS